MLTLNDLRIAGRQLRRAPGYTAAAVATLALAIGATTVIASAVQAVLLRPLPIADPARLVVSWGSNPSLTSGVIELSYLDVADIGRDSRQPGSHGRGRLIGVAHGVGRGRRSRQAGRRRCVRHVLRHARRGRGSRAHDRTGR